jgi:hypothetical protein
VSERQARLALAAATLALTAATGTLDLPRAASGQLWGDSATYHAMAWSLALDHDLRYERRDLERIRAEYPEGPQGIFLKRASGGLALDLASGFPWVRRVRPDEGRLYFAKAFVHPLLAAPLVRLLGTRGLVLLNGLLLSAALWLGYGLLRRNGHAPGSALGVAFGLGLLTIVPLYLVWPTPEILGLALVTGALAAWAAGRPLLSALLFGVAGYLKPPNVLMAAPLGLDPLLPAAGGPDRTLGSRIAETLRRGAVLAAATAALYAANAALTGELNYQGGERKTFYGRFPFDATGASFDDAGTWMTTNQLGPLVAGRDEQLVTAASGPARAAAEIRESFLLNLGYFWIGRFGGALGYYFPALAALSIFLLSGPRERSGWLALVAIVASWLAYVSVIPDNWYGGGGTVGNRYFLAVLPGFLLLVPPRRGAALALFGLVSAAAFLAPALASPVRYSLAPGALALSPPFRALPAELTMLNDLSVFTQPWRKKRPFGFTGDASRHADPDAFFLYFLDDGCWGREEWAGRSGFWLRGGSAAEVVVRAFDIAPLRSLVLRVRGGPRGDIVLARFDGAVARASVGPGEERELVLAAGRGVRYYDTYLHVLRLESKRGAALPDGRVVGAFVGPSLSVVPGAGRP